jgi:hypothetical protein
LEADKERLRKADAREKWPTMVALVWTPAIGKV